MYSNLCVNCGKETTATVDDLGSYNRHKVPVWHCTECELSTPVLKEDRYEWVDSYKWDLPGLIYNNRVNKEYKCRACLNGDVYANVEHLIVEKFPFFDDAKPAWVCYKCGFSDKAFEEDKYLWADKFSDWS